MFENHEERRSEKGFTLIELKDTITKVQIKELEGALQMFSFDMGRYPSSSEGWDALIRNPGNADAWRGPYLSKDVPKDSWGKLFIYRFPGTHNNEFDLFSCGADGSEGTEDDVCNWK